MKCLIKDEVAEYMFGIISNKHKRRVEEHLYGKISSSHTDNELNIEIESHSGGGCQKCFKILAEIIEARKASAAGNEVIRHL